jgi:two-component system, NarL family, nitrate/nitrite response regulator NarL
VRRACLRSSLPVKVRGLGYRGAVSGVSPRVLLASGDASFRTGLRVALESAGFSIAAEVSDAQGAVSAAVAQRPELVLISADLPGGAFGAVREASARLPGTRVVVLTRSPTGEELVAAVQAGAAGYLGEDVSQARLPAVMRGILDGEVALPRRETQHLLDAMRGRDSRQAAMAARAATALTNRELEVLDMLVAETSTGEMARRLEISQVTVRRHVSSVLGKLRLPSRAAAVKLLGQRSAE